MYPGASKRSMTPPPRTPKRQRFSLLTPPTTPRKPTFANRRNAGPPIPSTPLARRGLPANIPPSPQLEVAGTGLGKLETFPPEVRELIYGFALGIDKPITVKECCGPTSTRRERDACKKHGKTTCKKIGIANGSYETSEKCGKFAVLLLSSTIYEEASWVLYNRGRLLIKVGEHMAKYVNEKPMSTRRHLQLPQNEHARNMWMASARFQDVRFEIPHATLTFGEPTAYTARLYQSTGLLLKAWECQPKKPTCLPNKPRTVIVDLGDLYKILPFNAGTHMDEYVEWAGLHFPFETPEADDLCVDTSRNLERMVQMISRHSDHESQWKLVVTAKFDNDDRFVDSDGEEMESAGWLYGLLDECAKYDVAFQTV
ncbi:hypothetical protein P280DRAFT_523445 [Massarina eburnea CBS 473.64]|uniref:Uncharacterized protein n=1 Tax=Massarina eburnea CBS 473.64 TaxID=1395130 RepID=A0A6A6RL23_9PLEO|nr:hypothetical protein P280DRAFT_523445 [Massarina eburnea CBS 473.64]